MPYGSAFVVRPCVTEVSTTGLSRLRKRPGSGINPHLFRDIAVTAIVDTDPGKIGITAPLLGHINPATTEEHYIHANQAIAGKRYRASVTALRDRLAKDYGNPFNTRGNQ